MPWGTSGNLSRSAGLKAVKSTGPSSTGHRDIISTPPPITASWCPAWTPMAANVTACWPDPQKRLRVRPDASTGQPAASTAMRPMQIPWSPCELPLPTTTSSMTAGVEAHPFPQRVEHLREQLLRVELVQRTVALALPPR